MTDVKKIKERNSAINSASPNVSSESMHTTNKKHRVKSINKITQTPENIPEPDYNNPFLSSLANLGKLIDEKYEKNYDLHIIDVINCIGEFINKYQAQNGWVLINFSVRPFEMALLEHKLTGNIPHFGKEICRNSRKRSNIIPNYQDDENVNIQTGTSLSRCIKIIKNRNEIHNENLNFLEFYKQHECIQILDRNLNNIAEQPRKAAEILTDVILNENKSENNELQTGEFFTLINIYDNECDNITDSEYDEKQASDINSITIDNKPDTKQMNQSSNKIQTQNIDLNCNKDKDNLTNDTYYTVTYLSDIWQTMEHNYIHQVKELLKCKEKLVNEIKQTKTSIIDTIDQTLQFNNINAMNLINNYENLIQTSVMNDTIKLKQIIFELQTNLWDIVDIEFEQLKQFIEHKINNQWIVTKNKTLIDIYRHLLDTELMRTRTTLNFLCMYYGDSIEHKIDDFNFDDTTDNNREIENFQILCSTIISKLNNHKYTNYKESIKTTDQKAWLCSILTEKSRCVDQIYRIKTRILLDKKYLDNLTIKDYHTQKVQTVYKFKINDINGLCELLKIAADAGKNIKGQINQISGQFYISNFSIFELICKQRFNSKENFSIKQLKTMVNKLLEQCPRFKMTINDLIKTLNEVLKIQQIYPENWPKENQFYHHFPREILGNNTSTIDWRDFVVQCMELSYPTIEQLLFYRKLFQENDVGDETITVDIFETTILWFENGSSRYKKAKWLLLEMYQVQNKLNYSVMLLAFCKDQQPWIGLGKSFGLLFGWNPFESKILQINQTHYQYEGQEIDVEDINSTHYSDLSQEEFVFDINIVTWFIKTNLHLYMYDRRLLGNIDISEIIKSVFAYIYTKQEEVTFKDLFQNKIMDKLYNTVFKYETKDLSEVVKTIVMKYNLNINNF